MHFWQINSTSLIWWFCLQSSGLSDIPGEAMVKTYCPKCIDVYTPKSSRHHHTDGAYFGTGFPHMLFMVHPEYRPKRPTNQFVPRWDLTEICVKLPWFNCTSIYILILCLRQSETTTTWTTCRLYGFKIHSLAYQIQLQAAANFKMPLRAVNLKLNN